MRTVRIRHATILWVPGFLLCLASAGWADVAADTSRAGPPVLPPASARAWQTGTVAPDKLQHFSLAFSMGLAFGIMTGEPAAAGGAAVLALGKEMADSRRSRFDGGDLLAGLLGAGCAALLVAALD